MLRKQQKRAAQGKQTAFRVNGQNVDPKRIARFVRRYGTSWDTNRGKEPETEPQSPEPREWHPVYAYNHTSYFMCDMLCYMLRYKLNMP